VIIKKALEGLKGVEKASISYSKKEGEVFFDPDKVTEKEIVNKVKEVGFKAKVIENVYR
jgi:copper chaperone CopZ